jgi:hypothetical protein
VRTHTFEREMSGPEREFLSETLRTVPGPVQRWARGTQNAVVLWAVSTLFLILIWLAFAWGARQLLHVEIGRTSVVAAWGAAVCAAFAIVSSIRWVKSWPDARPLLQADLESNRVAEEHYQFVAARRFQEPEHGGLIYFLRTSERNVMVFFDHESQDLGARGEDPLKSSFEPRSELLMVRAPRARFIIDKQFSGEVLDAGEPVPLTLDPHSWPDSEEYCEIPWDELDARLSSQQPA